jgi:hypothetical protein
VLKGNKDISSLKTKNNNIHKQQKKNTKKQKTTDKPLYKKHSWCKNKYYYLALRSVNGYQLINLSKNSLYTIQRSTLAVV